MDTSVASLGLLTTLLPHFRLRKKIFYSTLANKNVPFKNWLSLVETSGTFGPETVDYFSKEVGCRVKQANGEKNCTNEYICLYT